MSSSRVTVFEVGPRDGLQNESQIVSTELKRDWILALCRAGLREIEVGAFVREDRVRAMADTDALLTQLVSAGKNTKKSPKINNEPRFWCLVPNQRGWERARQAQVRGIGVFSGATETFVKKNIGLSIAESLKGFAPIISDAVQQHVRVRGYVSMAFGCPFEGVVRPARVLKIVEKLFDLGVHEVSIGDTIGVADPRSVEALVKPALKLAGKSGSIALHFHDTRGTALANALRGLELGVRVLDSSAGGLGGCPYAPGARGNLATEDLVYMLESMGLKTGIDLEALARANLEFGVRARIKLQSRTSDVARVAGRVAWK